MERFKFFDLSISQKASSMSGNEVPYNEIVKLRKGEDIAKFDSAGFIEDVERFDFDPLGIRNTSRWDKAASTMVYAVSGQVPDREEIKRGRQLIEGVPKRTKEYVDRSFVLNFLPYLLTGFNFQLTDTFVDEANTLKDGINFVNSVYSQQNIHSSSLLCAHRESGSIAKLSLVQNIHTVKAKRTLALQLGLLSNAQTERGRLDWYQQTSTARLSSNMFPEMFINYLKAGNVVNLIRLVQSHKQQMVDILTSGHARSWQTNLITLDKLTSDTEMFMINRFGVDWNKFTGNEGDPDMIFKITRDYTLPHIKRLMPFYNQSESEMQNLEKYRGANINNARDDEEKKIVGEVIDWFIDHQRLSGFGKALYETSMYYHWGMMSKNESGVGIGVDRDYSNYQYLAFKSGYLNGGLNGSVPLLYARRTKNEIPQKMLKYISFRQFWRDAE